MPALLATLLLLLLPALAPAQPLHELLALIEQHNPELVKQRRLLDATTAAGITGDDAGVLALLRQQEQSGIGHMKVYIFGKPDLHTLHIAVILQIKPHIFLQIISHKNC